MSMVMQAIDQMTAEEKLQTMDYLWASLSTASPIASPDWHQQELSATEARVAAGVEKPVAWRAARAFLKEMS